MPYQWTSPPGAPVQILELRAHQSLPARGMAAFVLVTAALITLPALALLGTMLLWALLPFLVLAIWGLFFALQKNHAARKMSETLTLTEDRLCLIHHPAQGGDALEWDCNRYWVRLRKYDQLGPVESYLTLSGNGREAEIGAFLSTEERDALFIELSELLKTA